MLLPNGQMEQWERWKSYTKAQEHIIIFLLCCLCSYFLFFFTFFFINSALFFKCVWVCPLKACFWFLFWLIAEHVLSTLFATLQRYSTTAILGKRIFSDEFDENDEQEGTKHQPIPVSDYLHVHLLNNFLFYVALFDTYFSAASSFFAVTQTNHKLCVFMIFCRCLRMFKFWGKDHSMVHALVW